MAFLSNTNPVKLIDLRTGEVFLIDEVLIPSSSSNGPEKINHLQVEKKWKGELETRVKIKAYSIQLNDKNIFAIKARLMSDFYVGYFVLADLPYSTPKRKSLIALKIIKVS